MLKKILVGILLSGTLTACGSTTLSVPDKIEYNGQEAFDVLAVYTSNFDYPPTDDQTAYALKELETGKKFSRLPARASKACPSGSYTILKREEAQVESYLISAIPQIVARWKQRFIIACD